jgi:hypothetical protein
MYLSIPETAALLRVCPATVRRWIAEGAAPFNTVQVGKRTFILADSIKGVSPDLRREIAAAVIGPKGFALRVDSDQPAAPANDSTDLQS